MVINVQVALLFGMWAGVGLLYFHIYNKLKDGNSSRYLHLAGSYADAGVKQLRRRGVSFLCGDAGPLALGAVVYQRLSRVPESQDCLERWAVLVIVVIKEWIIVHQTVFWHKLIHPHIHVVVSCSWFTLTCRPISSTKLWPYVAL